jgi:hypothetical protein
VIAKLFGTYVFPRNLGLSQGKIHCSPGKVPFSLRNLGPSPKKTYCSPEKKKLIGEVFFTPLGTCLGFTFNLYFPKEVTS